MRTLHNKKTIDFPIPMDIHARNITHWLLPEYGTLVPSLLKFQPGFTPVPKVLFGHINSLWLFWACLINFILEGTMTINSRDFYHHRRNKPGVWFHQTHLCKPWLKKTSSGNVSSPWWLLRPHLLYTIFLVLPHNAIANFAKRGDLYTLVTGGCLWRLNKLPNALYSRFVFFILTYKITPEKQHWNLIMKLAGPLVALFINKRNTTWPTAMTPMLLLDTDQIRMILYYGCLSSES